MTSREKAERVKEGTAPAPEEEPVEDASDVSEADTEQEEPNDSGT